MAPSTGQFDETTNECGFVLIGALFILLLLVLIGIAASTSTVLEIQIAAADRVRKETFYQADAGTQLAIRLLEENIASNGFTVPGADGYGVNAAGFLVDPFNPNNTTIFVANPNLSTNTGVPLNPSDVNRDIAYFPAGYDPTNATPHTNITAGETASGAIAGESASEESLILGTTYTINSLHVGRGTSESQIQVQWLHVTDTSGTRAPLPARY